MNVFEDLIVELKEENLLENTVIDDDSPENADFEESETVEVLNNSDEAPEFAAPDDPDEVSAEAEIVSELTEQVEQDIVAGEVGPGIGHGIFELHAVIFAKGGTPIDARDVTRAPLVAERHRQYAQNRAAVGRVGAGEKFLRVG